MKRNLITVLALVLVLWTSACGKKDAATPPPVPANPNPVPGFNYGTVNGTNCPTSGGEVPFNRDGSPSYAQLDAGMYGGSSSNTLTLSFAFVRYTNAASPIQNIVGSGSFSYPDLVRFLPTGGTTQNYNICLSSNSYGQSTSVPGTFNMQDMSLQLVLRGVVQVPYSSPFGGMPGTTAPMGQETIEVAIGQRCRAYLYNNRIVGCVDVRLGNGYSQIPPYIAR